MEQSAGHCPNKDLQNPVDFSPPRGYNKYEYLLEVISVKKINTAIDRFCYSHPRFGIPNLILWVVIGNVIVYVMDLLSQGTFSGILSFVPAYIFQGQVWRLITFVFVPESSGNVLFFAISTYFYYFVGSRMEEQWGTPRFNIFYLSGILLAIAVGLLASLTGLSMMVTTSMYYTNLSLFFAFASLFPDLQVLFCFVVPVKIKWLAYLDAIYLLYHVLVMVGHRQFIMALLPILAILNYLVFFGDSLLGSLRWRKQRFQHKTSRQTIHFKQATKQAQLRTGYLHKCCVCGKTDADYPNLEFRYCSKCDGYRCYCMEHINNHIHVRED